MSSRKFESGASKRKRRVEENKFIASQKGSILRHFHPISNSAEDGEDILNEPLNSGTVEDEVDSELIKEADSELIEEIGNRGDDAITSLQSEQVNLTDPGLWPKIITQNVLDMIIKVGPQRIANFDFPLADGRRFTEYHYKGKLPNSDNYDRKWLVYSVHSNATFYFPCKLFGSRNTKLTSTGSCSWKHLGSYLVEHEKSQSHKECCLSWKETARRLDKVQTVDALQQWQLSLEVQYWQNILKRIIAATKFLAEHNLAFRGHSDKLFTKFNGNFMGLMEMISEFDPVLQEHLRKIKSAEVSDHYLGNRIQNEIINLLGNETKNSIISCCQESKYFSIIMDCTRDISRQEQLTSVIRYFNMESFTIEEHFLGFVKMSCTTGEILTETFLDELQNSGLDIMNCRGQSYDNGANMRGCNVGVQKKILDINPKAFFVPCSSHSLNLVVCDAAHSCVKAVSFFGLVQEIYNFFSGSAIRWDVLLRNVKTLTLKPLSDTRWESRIESLKTLKYEFCKVYDALVEIANNTSQDSSIRFQANNLAKQMCNFQFMTTLGIWYNILFQVNLVNKRMQSSNFDMSMAKDEMDGLLKFFRDLRYNGISDGVVFAKEVAPELGVTEVFEETCLARPRKKKRLFSYEVHEEPVVGAEKRFVAEVFNVILDKILTSLTKRFDQLKAHTELFGFLFDIPKSALDSDELLKHCKDLELALTHNQNLDLKSQELYDECRSFAKLVLTKNNPKEVVKYIMENSYQDSFPNILIALRILLTVPVTVAAGERSFSKLKLIKTYLRSTMSQLRLNGLAFISIESDMLKKIDVSKHIDLFANLKARKVKFT